MTYIVDCPKHGRIEIKTEKEVKTNGMKIPCPFCHLRCEWYNNLIRNYGGKNE